MKLSEAIDIYVLRRHAMGQKFEGPAATPRAFSRRYSGRGKDGPCGPPLPRPLQGVSALCS